MKVNDNKPTNNQRSRLKIPKIIFRSRDIVDTTSNAGRNLLTHITAEQQPKQSLVDKIKKAILVEETVSGETKTKLNPKFKRTLITSTSVILIVTGSLIAYSIIKDRNTFSIEKANAVCATDPNRAINIYDKLIKKQETVEDKIYLLYNRIRTLEQNTGDNYAEQIIKDAYQAYNLYPSYTTVEELIRIERKYGSEEEAKKWQNELEDYSGIELKLKK